MDVSGGGAARFGSGCSNMSDHPPLLLNEQKPELYVAENHVLCLKNVPKNRSR